MRSRAIPRSVLTLGLVIFVMACGAAGGDQSTPATTGDAVATDTAPTAAAPDTAEPVPTTTDDDEPGSGDLPGLPDMSGGSATLTIAGDTQEFDWFVCFYGDAVAVLEGDEDTTFLGIGRRGGSFPAMDGVEAQVIVSREVLGSGLNYSVLYRGLGSDGAEALWQGGGYDIVTGADLVAIEGDRVTYEGSFDPIIDGQPSNEDAEMGALDATCSPNSIGSDE